jgi:hypothetical protein
MEVGQGPLGLQRQRKKKRPGHEANHLPPTSAENKNGGAIPSLPHTSVRSVVFYFLIN